MLRDIGLAILFLVSAAVDVTFIHALREPLALLPLHFIIGVIVFHRSDEFSGGLWFAISSVFLPVFGFEPSTVVAYLAMAFLGALLTRRIFTNRSVYALVGLGASLYFFFALINAIIFALFPPDYGFHLGSYIASELLSLLMLIVGLYLGFILVGRVKRMTKNTFLVRQT